MIKQKGLLISIILFTMCVSIITSLFCVFAFYKQSPKQQDKPTAIHYTNVDTANGIVYLNEHFTTTSYCIDPDTSYYSGSKTVEGYTYNFNNTGVDYFVNKKIIKDEIYEKYNTYIIEDAVGLQIFADNVWQIETRSSEGHNGRYRAFTDKTVKLATDIELGTTSSYGTFTGIGWSDHSYGNLYTTAQFSGTFDGQGYTVSNFNLNGAYKTFRIVSSGFLGLTKHRDEYVGFFSAVVYKTTIKNLRLKNFAVSGYTPENDTVRSFVGGLVGIAYNKNYADFAKIQQCSIENFNAKFGGNLANKEYAAGIICKGYADIQNCYVSNVCEYGDVTNFNHIGPFGKLDFEDDSTWSEGGARLQDCVVNNYNTYKYNLSDGQTSVANVFVNWNPMDGYPTTCLWNNNDNGNSLDSINPSDVSAFSALRTLSNVGGEDVSIWYGIMEYNNGWPYLRIFIKDWTTYDFYTESETSYDIITITAPLSIKTTIKNKVIGNTSRTINVANTNITTSEISGYHFLYWALSYDDDYWVEFYPEYELDGYTIRFKEPRFNNETVSCTPSASSINVKEGMTISVTITYNLDLTVLTYTINGEVITYNISPIYEVSSCGVIGSENIENLSTIPDMANGTFVDIAPVLVLKQYDISFD